MSVHTRLEGRGGSGLGEVDEPAFSGLAERHRRELHVHCYRMLGSFEDAEDTVQETFLRAWRRRETFEGRSTFRAWLYRVGPRDSFPGVRTNRALARVLPDLDPGVWWVTCFVVDSRHRRAGIGGALLQADVELARAHGASAVEGHPVDVSALKATKVSGSAIYTGTVVLFTAAEFVEVGRTAPTRPVMRRRL